MNESSTSNEELLRKAEKLNDKKDWSGAIRVYTQIINQFPPDPWSYWERGLAKKSKGDLNGALKDFEEAIKIDPKHSYSYYQRGLIKQKRKDKKGAEADFEKSRTLRKENPFVKPEKPIEEKPKIKEGSFEKDGRSY